MENLKIKMIDEELQPPAYIKGGDWIDLRASKIVVLGSVQGLFDNPITYNLRNSDSWIREGYFLLIKLGVAMQIPKGFEAHVVPRSSTFKNFGLIQTNSVGIIDNSYCGDGDEWMFPCVSTKSAKISHGDRICQFRIERRMPVINIEIVDSLGNPDRGGHGSTGVS